MLFGITRLFGLMRTSQTVLKVGLPVCVPTTSGRESCCFAPSSAFGIQVSEFSLCSSCMVPLTGF